MGAEGCIRVVVVDDHEIVRAGLRYFAAENSTPIEVVAEASTVRDGLELITTTRPDVAVVDVRLPDGDGIELVREVHPQVPEVRCLVVTGTTDDSAARRALEAGAFGYVRKEVRGGKLVQAILDVADGELRFDPAVLRGELHLTPRERAVLEGVRDGLLNKQIAGRLGVGEATVKTHLANVFDKTGTRNRAALAAFAAERLGPRRP